MTVTLSDYQKNQMLDARYGSGTPATYYYALMTTLPAADGTGGVEVSGGSYARAALTNNATNFPAASGGAKTGASGTASFPTPTAPWSSIVGVCEFDAPTGGNMTKFVAISTVTYAVGGIVSVKATDLSLSLT